MSNPNADKRTVATDALETLGLCPIPDNSERDAIHLAVESVVAAEMLLPGQDIGFVDGKASGKSKKMIGIVDPFIKGPIAAGTRFWLVVYPREITSLRHVWTHPDFAQDSETPEPKRTDPAASEVWLRDFIASADCPDYDTVIASALGHGKGEIQDFGDGDIYLFFRDMDAHGSIPPEFWDHLEIVAGIKIPADDRATGFSCSC